MKLKKAVTLKNGQMIELRSLQEKDARQAILLCRAVSGETLNMMRYPDEWTISLEKEAALLKSTADDPKALMLGAFWEGKLVGMGNFAPAHPADRARHRARLGICVLRAYWGRGIGAAMMQTLIDAAKMTSLEQLELDVVSTNESAIHLYKCFGFVEFGRHPRMMKYRDGTYADTVLMALDLCAQE